MKISSIAGFCPEEAIWKFLADLSRQLQSRPCRLSPEGVVVDGDHFLPLFDDGLSLPAFDAPDWHDGQPVTEAQAVWTLGALAVYLSTGHVLFGGRGGIYQRDHAGVPVPALPKAHRSLTPVVWRCLCADPSERITLKELETVAVEGLAACSRRPRQKVVRPSAVKSFSEPSADGWPEAMDD